MIKIVVPLELNFYPDQAQRLESFGEVIYYHTDPKSVEEWFERCKEADIICPGMYGMKSEKVYDLKNVFISLPYVGADFLDRKRLQERNIVVTNSPGGNQEAVVERIIGMILTYFRKLNILIGAKDFPKKDILESRGKGVSLFDKKITILGHGHIGTLLGKICESFGMKVNFFLKGDNLIESAKNADIIANCLPLNNGTKGLLNRDFFLSLKKGSFFISSSRDETYDTDAMINALDKEILIGVADDSASSVAGDIEYPHYQKLLNHPKIIVTPHIAWNTDYEKRKSNDIMIDNIEAWLSKNPINTI